MPEWFRKLGYTTVSVGKVSHHPGGRGGKDWDDPDVIEMPGAWNRHLMPVGDWRHPRGTMHGLANGQIRVKGRMSVIQATEGPDSIYPDGLIVDKALQQLDLLSSDKSKPFFLAVGLIKPHLPFGCPQKYLDLYADVDLPPIPHPDKPQGLSTWHKSGEFFGQYVMDGKDPRTDEAFADEVRRHYAACVSYADASVGRIIDQLRQTGEDKNTIIVLWGDHGWNLGEHGIWGKHNLFEEALRSPLIVVEPGDAHVGGKTMAIVETLDIFPTICDLAEVSKPDFVEGVSLVPIVKDPSLAGRPAVSYSKKNRTLRTQSHRLILHKDGGVELYDHNSSEKETKNIAEGNTELVGQLTAKLNARLPRVRDR
jgi:iduronate 2-sulfatase